MSSTLKNPGIPDAGTANLSLFAHHPLPTWVVDRNHFNVRFSNEAALRLYGYTAEEFLQTSFLDLFCEESRPVFFHRLLQGDPAFHFVCQHRHSKGSLLKITLYLSLLDAGHLLASAVELGEQAPGRLQEERDRYKTYFEQSFEGIFCQEFIQPVPVSLDPDEIVRQFQHNSYISTCNDVMARMYGFEKADELKSMLTASLIDYSDPANIASVKEFIAHDFRIINAVSYEKDRLGNPVYFLNNAIGIVEDGCLKRVWGTQRDITAQKKAEQELQLLASLVEQTSDVLTASDMEFRPLTWNKAAEEVYGLKAADVIGKYLSDFITIHYYHYTREEVRAAIVRDGEWRGEAWFVRPGDQKTVSISISFKLFRDPQNKLLGYIIGASDITEKKAAESRLRESESRFRDMADSSPAMIWMSDAENCTMYINHVWLQFTGVNIVGRPDGWSALLHKDDVEKARADYSRAFHARQKATLTYRLRRADGSYRWVHDISVPRFLNDGQFFGYIGSVVDIEEQKLKQEQLLYEATILENVSDIIVTTDLEFKVKVWNKTAEQYYEVPEAEAIGKKINDLIHFTFFDANEEYALFELQKKGCWQGEVSTQNKKGETIYYFQTVKYVHDRENTRIGILAVGRDITDRKLAEEKVKQSELFYRTLIADSLDGMLLVDEAGKITFCSPSVQNVLGYDTEELLGKNSFDYVHPEDIGLAIESFQKEVVENPRIKFIVVRLLQKNGTWLWCMVRGHNLLSNPSIGSVVIYFHDDTLRKQATEALSDSERRFRSVIRDLHTGVFIEDVEGRITMSNNAVYNMFEIEEADLLQGKTWHLFPDAVHEDGQPFLLEDRPAYKALHTKQLVADTVMGVLDPRTNQRVWLLVSADPILDEQGAIMHVVNSFTNITETKKLQEELFSKQINHQRQLTQASIDGQEKERREIGKELHDNIGQQLTTIKLFLDLAKTSADDATNEMVGMALKGVSDLINEIRNISRSLIPSTLNDLGLIESINELADSIRRTQLLQIGFDHLDFEEDLMPDNQKLTLFRIVQEQLNNIVKHAGASQAWMELRNKEHLLVLRIRDNGRGFDLKKMKKGLGFINIKNRAELFNGQAKVYSNPGGGCLLEVWMPLYRAETLFS